MDGSRGIRILQVIPSLWQGGLERVATTLTIALAAAPAVERILVASSRGEPYLEELERGGIDVVQVPRPYPRPVAQIGAARALARIIRDDRPDVIHAHNPGAAAAVAIARMLARTRVPVVSTYHGVTSDRLRRAVRAMARSDIVVGVSPTATRTLTENGLDPARARTIMNAVEPRPLRSVAEVRSEFGADGVPLLVTVGRYVAEKNQSLLLEALARIEPTPRALVVGYGPRMDELRDRAAALGIDHAVTVTGERNDAQDLIAAADVFVLSSISEALPVVLIEAMSLGTPVVATGVGGVGDVIADGRTGLLVPSGSAEALAGAIRRVLDDGELARRLADEAGRFAVEHCSVGAMTASYLGVYTEAIARRAGASPST
jgi:glycosyltransferase involved in cell wall biosynthesis